MGLAYSNAITRRDFSQRCAATAAGAVAASQLFAADTTRLEGAIRGEPTAEKAGRQILASGGNAIDAAVAAAFTAAVAAPHQTGIGGYGGHMTLALAKSGKITSIDFNSEAPATARADMFPLDAQGKVVEQKN